MAARCDRETRCHSIYCFASTPIDGSACSPFAEEGSVERRREVWEGGVMWIGIGGGTQQKFSCSEKIGTEAYHSRAGTTAGKREGDLIRKSWAVLTVPSM